MKILDTAEEIKNAYETYMQLTNSVDEESTAADWILYHEPKDRGINKSN